MSALPEEMWFGRTDGQWPISCWESETHAMAFLAKSGPEDRRRIWKARVVEPVEFGYVNPKPYLQEKEGGGS